MPIAFLECCSSAIVPVMMRRSPLAMPPTSMPVYNDRLAHGISSNFLSFPGKPCGSHANSSTLMMSAIEGASLDIASQGGKSFIRKRLRPGCSNIQMDSANNNNVRYSSSPPNHPSTHSVRRLYSKARHLGYKRGKHLQHPLVSLLQIENVSSSKDACFYLGKRVAYVYRAKKAIAGSKTRVIWGRVARVHGNSGVVRARFAKPLPPRSFGAAVRVVR